MRSVSESLGICIWSNDTDDWGGQRTLLYVCYLNLYLFRKKSKPGHQHYCYEGSNLQHLQTDLAFHRPFSTPPRPRPQWPQWRSNPFAAADRQLANLEGTGGPMSSHGM